LKVKRAPTHPRRCVNNINGCIFLFTSTRRALHYAAEDPDKPTPHQPLAEVFRIPVLEETCPFHPPHCTGGAGGKRKRYRAPPGPEKTRPSVSRRLLWGRAANAYATHLSRSRNGLDLNPPTPPPPSTEGGVFRGVVYRV